MAKFHAVAMNAKDNVATLVEPVESGTEVIINIHGATVTVKAQERILAGHKLALSDLQPGEPVIKYGEVIGLVTQPIRAGQHVHVHNLESCRGRGDKN